MARVYEWVVLWVVDLILSATGPPSRVGSAFKALKAGIYLQLCPIHSAQHGMALVGGTHNLGHSYMEGARELRANGVREQEFVKTL